MIKWRPDYRRSDNFRTPIGDWLASKLWTVQTTSSGVGLCRAKCKFRVVSYSEPFVLAFKAGRVRALRVGRFCIQVGAGSGLAKSFRVGGVWFGVAW